MLQHTTQRKRKVYHRLKEVAYRYFKGVSLNRFLRASAYIVSREAYGVGLSWPTESHFSRGNRRLGRVLVVPVYEVWGQEDGNDEGEEQSCGDDGLTHVVTYHLWRIADTVYTIQFYYSNLYFTLLASLLCDLRQLTLNIFLFTETFLRVAVAGSVAGLDPVPQASFMTTSNSFLFSDKKCENQIYRLFV